MRTRPGAGRSAGFALVLVMVLAAIGLLLLCSMLDWSGTEARLADRRHLLQRNEGMAKATIDMVVAQMMSDFHQGGGQSIDANLLSYPQLATRPELQSLGPGRCRVVVQKLADWKFTALESGFIGLLGQAATFRVVARLEPASTVDGPTALVGEDVQFAAVPLFQFGLYYGVDLELTPADTTWTVRGRVHCNGDMYCQPDQCSLVLSDYTTAAGQILKQKNPLDPTERIPGSVSFSKDYRGGVKNLIIPTGTANSPDVLHALIDVAPPGEPISSALGQQRYYNKADLVILVSDTTSVAKSGAYNNFSITLPWSRIGGPPGGTNKPFVNTTNLFFDKREGAMVQVTQIDIGMFRTNDTYLQGVLGRPVRSLYVADQRTNTGMLAAVRLVSATTLPTVGLTVATPNPLYVLGNFNTGKVPASMAADAVTFLSPNWKDANSTGDLSQRKATATTVNAAVLTGIVPTGGGYYSGGAQNALRLLEDWTARRLTFNGSLVVVYNSTAAAAPWGATAEVYDPPTRTWTFDSNFLIQSKLPPGTPEVRTCYRTQLIQPPNNVF